MQKYDKIPHLNEHMQGKNKGKQTGLWRISQLIFSLQRNPLWNGKTVIIRHVHSDLN